MVLATAPLFTGEHIYVQPDVIRCFAAQVGGSDQMRLIQERPHRPVEDELPVRALSTMSIQDAPEMETFPTSSS